MENDILTNEVETQKIMNFIAHCNNYIAGRYLFGASILKEVYHDIQTSKELKQLFNECLDGFNISLFKTKCLIKLPTKAGTFTAPTEKEDFVALAYSMIEDICKETVDYDTFIAKYFTSEKDENKFGKQVVEPLKNIVAKLFNLPDDNDSEFEILDEKPIVPQLKFDNTDAIAVAQNIISVISQNANATEDEKNAVIILFELIQNLQSGNQSAILCYEIALTYIEKNITGINYLFEELFFCLDQII